MTKVEVTIVKNYASEDMEEAKLINCEKCDSNCK
jgi:hypothetical protein